MRLPATLALTLLVATPALADEVVLKDGQRIEGVAREVGDEIEVQLDFGTVSFAKSEVASVKRGATRIAELSERRAALRSGDVEGLYRLGVWAERHELHSQSRAIWREVIDASPDHMAARQALGFRKHEGRWLTEDEYMTAQGLVRFEGKWMKPEAVAQLQAAAKARAEQAEKRREQERIASLERQVAEAKAESERARRAAEAKKTEQVLVVPYYGWPIGTPIRGGGVRR